MKKTSLALAALFSLSLILAGCSSSNSGGGNGQPPPPLGGETPPPGGETPPPGGETPPPGGETPPPTLAEEIAAAKTIPDPLGAMGAEFAAVPGTELKALRVSGQTVPDAPYSFSGLQNGLNTLLLEVDYGPEPGSNNQSSGTVTGNLRIYEQPYSMVIGTVYTQDSGTLMDADDLNVHEVEDVRGLETTSAVIDALTITAT